MNLYTVRQELLRGISIYDIPLKVVFYARVSTMSDDQLHSLGNQVDFFKDFVKDKPKWNLVDFYVDEGITGTTVTKRESFMKMISDAKKGKFDLILTKEVSRFARNTLDSIFYTRRLLDDNVGVFFINDNINTIEVDSELRLTIMASMAQDESRKMSSRVKFGYQRSIKNGVVLGNNKIWGYKKDNGKLVIIPEDAEMIRKTFQLYSEGNGYRKIGDTLYSMGYVNTNGNKFGSNTLKSILTNPKYKGYYCGNKNTKIDIFSNKRQKFDEDDWVMWKDETGDTVPAIVNEELWDRCNKIMEDKLKKIGENEGGYSNRYPYSEKIKCKKCDSTYWRTIYKYKSGDKELWQCKNYRKGGLKACDAPTVYTDELNEVIKSIVLNKRNIDLILNLIDLSIKNIPKKTDASCDVKKYNEQLNVITLKKEKLLELSIENMISNKEFKKRNDLLNIEYEKINLLIEKCDERNEKLSKNILEINKFRNSIKSIIENSSNSSNSTTLLNNLIDIIIVDRDVNYDSAFEKVDLEIKFDLDTDIIIYKSYIKKNNGIEIL